MPLDCIVRPTTQRKAKRKRRTPRHRHDERDTHFLRLGQGCANTNQETASEHRGRENQTRIHDSQRIAADEARCHRPSTRLRSSSRVMDFMMKSAAVRIELGPPYLTNRSTDLLPGPLTASRRNLQRMAKSF